MRLIDAPLVKRLLVIAAVLGLMVAGFAGRAPAAEPDAVYFNGKIVTLDAAGSTVGAVAVQDGKVLKVGSADEIKKLAGPSTRLVDLGGKTVVPGFIDAHCHPMETIYDEGGLGGLPLSPDPISQAGACQHSRLGQEDTQGRMDLCGLRFRQ